MTSLPIHATLRKGDDAGTREERLGSVTGFSGTLQGLGQAACGGPQTDRPRCYSQASSCSAGCALGLASNITDAAVVHHGPAGCAVTSMSTHNSKDQLARTIGRTTERSAYVSTDMTDADTVFGATDTLREVVVQTQRRYGSQAVFIGASCVSGVIGEDIDSVARELTEELGVPVAPVHCEGFRSKIWASGFDALHHALLTHVVRPAEQRRPQVNVINFFGSARAQITRLFARLGVEPLFLVANTTIDELAHLSEALATVSTCGTLGTYLGTGLEEQFGVPYVKSLQPLGVSGYESWLRGLGEVLGRRADVEEILAEERELYAARLEAVTERLRGTRAVIGMGPGWAHNMSRVLQEFGIEIAHVSAWHHDSQYDDGRVPEAFAHQLETSPYDYPVSVTDLQNHEIMTVLHRLRPDLYLSRHPGSTVWAVKQGIPAICLVDEYDVFGYEGTLRFATELLDLVTNPGFARNLARRVRLPYTSWWMGQPDDLFMDLAEETADV